MTLRTNEPVVKSLAKKAHALHQRLVVAIRRSAPFARRVSAKRVFFPGCSLTGGGGELTLQVYEHLRRHEADIDIWLSCCGMPVQKYSGKKHGLTDLHNLAAEVRSQGITEVITACGNCYERFQKLRDQVPELKVTSLYAWLTSYPIAAASGERFLVHHPCPAKVDADLKRSFASCAAACNVNLGNGNANDASLLCCLVKSEAQNRRIDKVKDSKIITWCGHCVKQFQSRLDITHVLSLLFNRPAGMYTASAARAFRRTKKRLANRSAGGENL
ncbi:MAG: hypothetical protein GF398_16480 [Chitinivibrionales bacterium]|nr:hypothetical protein [Chitinivibrionales bacterium]